MAGNCPIADGQTQRSVLVCAGKKNRSAGLDTSGDNSDGTRVRAGLGSWSIVGDASRSRPRSGNDITHHSSAKSGRLQPTRTGSTAGRNTGRQAHMQRIDVIYIAEVPACMGNVLVFRQFK